MTNGTSESPISRRLRMVAGSETPDGSDEFMFQVEDPTRQDYLAVHPTGHVEFRTGSGDPGTAHQQTASFIPFYDSTDNAVKARVRTSSGSYRVVVLGS